MLIPVFSSLLAGAAAIVLLVYLTFVMPVTGLAEVPVQQWDARTARAVVGTAAASSGGLTLTLDEFGRGVMLLPAPEIEAASYPLLHLQFDRKLTANTLGIFWQSSRTGEQIAKYWMSGEVPADFTLNLGGLDLWRDRILELGILIRGRPGEQLELSAIELRPPSLPDALRALVVDWWSFTPWDLGSTNFYHATGSGQTRHSPVLYVGGLFLASTLAYWLILALFRSRLSPDWRVLPALFLICWLCLDLPWQLQLLRHLDETHARYAGMDSREKLLAGPDAVLVQFMSDVRERIGPSGARVFVASSDDYKGMRGSYYLYPSNVYWRRGTAQLPPRSSFQSGDFIVLLQPSEVRFDPQEKVLLAGDDKALPVQLLVSSDFGSLFRVM